MARADQYGPPGPYDWMRPGTAANRRTQGNPSPPTAPWEPYRAPTAPPQGLYDPAIDAQWRAAQRGYGDLGDDSRQAQSRAFDDYQIGLGDIATGRARTAEDYNTGLARNDQSWMRGVGDLDLSTNRGREDLERGYGRNVQDVETGYGRNLADLLTGRTRGGEDYARSGQELGRQYQRLGEGQNQAIRGAGGGLSGAVSASAKRRAENEAFDRVPLDRNFQRFTADSAQAEGRLGEDRGQTLGRLGEDRTRASGRLDENWHIGRGRLWEDRESNKGGLTTAFNRANEDASSAEGRLSLGYQRGTVDRSSGLARSGRELGAFGQDLNEQKWWTSGYEAPAAPAGEGSANGVPFRQLADGRYALPNGQVVSPWTLMFSQDPRVRSHLQQQASR